MRHNIRGAAIADRLASLQQYAAVGAKTSSPYLLTVSSCFISRRRTSPTALTQLLLLLHNCTDAYGGGESESCSDYNRRIIRSSFIIRAGATCLVRRSPPFIHPRRHPDHQNPMYPARPPLRPRSASLRATNADCVYDCL